MTSIIRNGDMEYDLDTMTKKEVLDLKVHIQEQSDSIKQQLFEARARAATHGEYSDYDWYSRANFALKAKGRAIQQIQIYLGSMKKERQNSIEKAFVNAARIHLDPDTFSFIMNEASAELS